MPECQFLPINLLFSTLWNTTGQQVVYSFIDEHREVRLQSTPTILMSTLQLLKMIWFRFWSDVGWRTIQQNRHVTVQTQRERERERERESTRERERERERGRARERARESERERERGVIRTQRLIRRPCWDGFRTLCCLSAASYINQSFNIVSVATAASLSSVRETSQGWRVMQDQVRAQGIIQNHTFNSNGIKSTHSSLHGLITWTQIRSYSEWAIVKLRHVEYSSLIQYFHDSVCINYERATE